MKFKSTIISFIKLSRPLNSCITFLVIIVAAIISAPDSFWDTKILLAAFSGTFTAMAGNVINDIYDIGVDRINRPERPLPSGQITQRNAFLFYVILVMTAFILSSMINIAAFVLVLFAANLLFLYSYKLKSIPLVGNIAVALLTGLAFIYGGIAVSNPVAAFIPALFAFIINLIREIVKDIEDVEGDIRFGIKTLPSKYGLRKTKIIVFVTALLLIAATFHPFLYGYYRIEYFITVMVLVNPLIVLSMKKLFTEHDKKSLGKISGLLKLSIVFGLIAIYLGR